jgi:hypothetical protein
MQVQLPSQRLQSLRVTWQHSGIPFAVYTQPVSNPQILTMVQVMREGEEIR